MPTSQFNNSNRLRPIPDWIGPAGLLIALGVLLVAAIVSYRNILKLHKASLTVAQTRQLIGVSESLQQSVVQAESSERGFLLTDEQEHLESYRNSSAKITGQLHELSELTLDNPQQQERLKSLRQSIDTKLRLMQRLVELPPESRKESFSRDRLLTHESQQMQTLRQQIGDIRTAEYGRLDNRLSANRAALSNAIFVSILTTLTASGLLIASFLLTRKAIRMRAETARLARYNQRLLESTGEGIYGIDSQGNCTFMNRAGALILGGRAEEFLGRNMHDLVHHSHDDGKSYPIDDCPIYRAFKTSQGCRIDDEVFWRRDGKPVPVEYSSFPLLNENVSEGAVVTFANIAARKKAAEELLAAKESAEQANAAKSQFLANMSHELRTPLNAVIMYSELIQEESEDRGLNEFIPDLKKIRQAGKHLLELVNSLLDLSKIEAGKMELFLESFTVGDVVRDVATTVQPLVEKNNNRLQVMVAEHLPQMHNDVTKIRQVLFNLLSNACKFTENGTIRLAVTHQIDQKRIKFEVSDTGIGMSDEQTARLFQPFMQADSSTTRKFGGTGLGLAIIKRFTDLMEGEVSVISQEGSGTTFTVTLPTVVESKTLPAEVAVVDDDESGAERVINGNPSAQCSPSSPAVHDSQNKSQTLTPDNDAPITVLVIDDDPFVRDVMMRVLVAEGIRPMTASDGMEGVQLARQLRPDLIVLDVLMPRVDGWSVLGILKADPELADIPIIMQTVRDDRDLAFMLGAADYIVKPVERERLLSVIRKYVSADAGNVLIVEDDQPTREALVRIVNRLKLNGIAANNGREAIASLEANDCDDLPKMILLDLMMPVMDGFEFLEILQANEDWRKIPVVVITAKQLTDEETKFLNGSVERVLTKGRHNRESLLGEIRRIVNELVTPLKQSSV